MTNSKRFTITSLIILILVLGTTFSAYATNGFQSNGRFEYKSDPSSAEADVVLDSSDLNTIYEEVSVGRGG